MSFRKLILLFIILMNLVSCSNSAQSEVSEDTTINLSTEMFKEDDYNIPYDLDKAISISLSDDSSSASSDVVNIDGNTITISEGATYLISGSLSNGMVIVNSEDDIYLVFAGVNIKSETSAALYVKSANNVYVILQNENYLSSGAEFIAIDENNIDGTIYAKDDIIFSGDGTLSIDSPAGHGVVAKDDLKIMSGTYYINSASHGFDINDSYRATASVYMTINAGKDAIHSENEEDSEEGFIYIEGGAYSLNVSGDALDASYYIEILDGSFDIVAGGGYENGESHSSSDWGMFNMGGRGQGFNRDDIQMPEDVPSDIEMPSDMPNMENMPSDMGEMPRDDFRGDMPEGFNPSDANNKDGNIELNFMQNEESVSEDSDSTSMKGIKSSGALIINGGTFNINSADDAIHSNSSITINNGNFNISSGDDAIHADDTLTINDGDFIINESYEGLEALYIYINGGTYDIKATDDGINAAGGSDQSGISGGRDAMFNGGFNTSSNGLISISAGIININASGDALDANGSIEISGGYIITEGPTVGDTSILDFDVSCSIENATFIGTGSSMMMGFTNEELESNSQGIISSSINSQSANSTLSILDSDGNVLYEVVPSLDYNYLIITSPEIISGNTYIIMVGGQEVTSVTAK